MENLIKFKAHKILLLVVLVIFSQSLFSQGLKSLDNEFGVKKFKLESSIKLYEKDMTYYWIDEKGTEYYNYSKEDIKLLFGKNVKNINLAFVDNKLYNITVVFGVLSPNESMELMDLLKSKYDVPDIFYPGGNLNYGAKWETGKVYMQLEEYSSTSPAFAIETHLFIMSKLLSKALKMK
jgi:hypothetical protein